MNSTLRSSPLSGRPAPVVLAVAGLCAGLEIVFTLADLAGYTDIRRTAIIYGAFWPQLLTGHWGAVFPGQRASMFLTYAVLHGGFLHMLFNMLIMLHLGRETVIRLGQAGFLLILALSAVGGAAGFALLNGGQAPMLGASGAVFGLFGTTIYWDVQRRRAVGAALTEPLKLTAGLVVMNVVLWLMAGGMLAWEAHLGGFVTGVILGRVVTPTLFHRHRNRSRRH
ncbi:MAG: rhomboid family intramembrane serine protease [Rhodobacter sp.]|nr:rhomboid family intramembrane serine protease [Rhodobacter sp.]